MPRPVGPMAVDAREPARVRGPFVTPRTGPGFRLAVADHVVRQYPRPGTGMPRDSVVHVWSGPGPDEGGGGVREPRGPAREPEAPAPPRAVVLSSP